MNFALEDQLRRVARDKTPTFTTDELGFEPKPACGVRAPISTCILPAGHPTGPGLPGTGGHLTARHQATVDWLSSIGASATVEQPTPESEPEVVPDGMVSVAELLKVVNDNDVEWCGDAEEFLNENPHMGLAVEDARDKYGEGDRFAASHHSPQFIGKVELALAMRQALRDYSEDVAGVIAAISQRLGVEPEPEYNDTYKVTFTVTSEQLREFDSDIIDDEELDVAETRRFLWELLADRLSNRYDGRYGGLTQVETEFDYTLTSDPRRTK